MLCDQGGSLDRHSVRAVGDVLPSGIGLIWGDTQGPASCLFLLLLAKRAFSGGQCNQQRGSQHQQGTDHVPPETLACRHVNLDYR